MQTMPNVDGSSAEVVRRWPDAGMRSDLINVVPPRSVWAAYFAEESQRIRQACGDVIVTVEHIGSTSVPGHAAKPIIDMMPGLKRYEDGERCVAPMLALGYQYRGEFGIAGRHYFTLDLDGLRASHVHMFVMGTNDWARHIVFRDALRRSETLCRDYAHLKRDLAGRFGDDSERYTDEKTRFIEHAVSSVQRNPD